MLLLGFDKCEPKEREDGTIKKGEKKERKKETVNAPERKEK